MRSLLFLFFLLILAWAIRELLFGSGRRVPPSSSSKPGTRGNRTAGGEEMVKDPQCGVYMPRSAAVKKKIDGETHYFCSQECSEKFSGRE
ncbi:YHS domain-containing protein [bacterium]|nr:MAG: YHS domain-containing protein [bacterium]